MVTAPAHDAAAIAEIDWSLPIEAVSINTGHVATVALIGECEDGSGDYIVGGVPDGFEVFRPSGRPWVGHDGGCEYRIRNTRASLAQSKGEE